MRFAPWRARRCTSWMRSRRSPSQEAKDAESIVERVVPRLQHANSAVVLSAVKARPRLPQILDFCTYHIYKQG